MGGMVLVSPSVLLTVPVLFSPSLSLWVAVTGTRLADLQHSTRQHARQRKLQQLKLQTSLDPAIEDVSFKRHDRKANWRELHANVSLSVTVKSHSCFCSPPQRDVRVLSSLESSA